MQTCNRLWRCGFAVLMASSGPAVHAATFCVDSNASFAAALATAQSNNQDDTIDVVVGTYALTSELKYVAAPGETYILNILGGHSAGCPGQPSSSGSTVLDGQNLVRQLSITAKGSVGLGYITFLRGHPSQSPGGALSLVNVSNTSATYVFDNVFVANKAADNNTGGVMYLSWQGDVHLWSNAIFGNSGSISAALLINSGNTYINGNTIVSNQLINHAGLGALYLAGTGHYWLANNILWNNEGSDVYDERGATDYAYNDLGVIDGLPPLSTNHEMSIEPGFTGFFGVNLSPDSPLVNAGLDDPPGGVGGCCDANHGRRVVGEHVDIGAIESDVLFRNGYESSP